MNQLEDMQTFVRIVEAGSITRAAEQLNTAKSAVSRRLQQLEQRLNITLITRTTRTQSLTDSGKSYYQQCLRILQDIEEVESGVRNDQLSLKGKIKVAAPLSFGLRHLSKALCDFNEMHPEIYFDVDFNDRQVDLIEEGFDLAIRIARLPDSNLIAKPIFSCDSILSASPTYLNKMGRPKSPNDLREHYKKLHYSGVNSSWHFNVDGQVQSISVANAMSANNGDFLCQAAIDGKGLLMTPDFICYKAIEQGHLEPILQKYLIRRTIKGYAIYPQTRHLSARVRRLVDFLAQYFGDKPYWLIQ